MKYFHKPTVNIFLIHTPIYITSNILLIYRIRTKPTLDPETSLRYNLAWNFLYSPYRVSLYFSESNITLTISCFLE